GGSLALLKFAVGVLTGSLAMISEGIHSSLDFLATLVTWISVKAADVPADKTHHYGHGKIENLSAFGQAIMLLLTACWIAYESVSRLISPPELEVGGNWWVAIAVISLSIVVDFSRSRALSKAAKKYGSQALEADALHFSTEMLSSSIVLIVLLIIKFFGPEYAWTDPVGAILVAAVMLFTASRLGRRAFDVLIDRAPEGMENKVQQLIRTIPGVRDVARIRARQAGNSTFVDATIFVAPELDLAASHEISDSVELRVTEQFPNLDIVVHVEPTPFADNHADTIRQLAKSMNLNVHAIRIRNIRNRLYINCHVLLPSNTTLAQAHQLVSELEDRIRNQIPAIAEIDTHMEPAVE
ncbi:MAG: cation-efflux pump, partial [Phycisphaerales bacterium]|nr:cation-efflux pump [Phycisphaerales bacterium]